MNIQRSRLRRFGAVTVAALLAVGLAAAPAVAKKPPAEWDGLALQQSKRFDLVYLRPNADFKVYRTVLLEPAVVAFDKNWDPNASQRDLSRRVSTEDMERIKQELGQVLREGLAKELAAGGYAIVDKAGEDTLRVQPGIVDLYINAPDTMAAGRSRTYVMDAGKMTLILQVSDGATGQLLGRVVDTKQGSDIGRLQWANSVSNSAEAQRIVSKWAKAFRAGLDRVSGKTPE